METEMEYIVLVQSICVISDRCEIQILNKGKDPKMKMQ